MGATVEIHTCTASDEVYDDVCLFAMRGYRERYKIDLVLYPDIFVYATMHTRIVGCFGGYFGEIHRPLTTEWYVSWDDIKKYVGWSNDRFCRRELAEIGTRVVSLPTDSKTNSVRVSVALSAGLLLYLYNQGRRLSFFTADRSVVVIAKQLNARLLRLGRPDITRRDEAYQEKWREYFNVPRECFIIDLEQTFPGCLDACQRLEQGEFTFEQVLLTSSNAELLTAS